MRESSSLLPPALRWAGPLLAACYGAGARVHRALSTPRRAPLPVICIGNLTVGGTGKTPAAKYFARGFAQRGRKPAVLLRGYKNQAGDEGAELTAALADLKIPILVGADRHASAVCAKEQGCDVALLDDGFQHWRLARDLDIVLVDATNPFGGGHLAPWGRLREHPEALARAGVVIVTRSDMASAEEVAALEKEIARHAPQAVLARARHEPFRLRELGGADVPLEQLRGRGVAVLCGIGNPVGFRRTLEQLGARVVRVAAHPDHHSYEGEDLGRLVRECSKDSVTIVTTEKDAAKLTNAVAGVWCLDVRFALTQGEEAVWERVERAVEGRL
jgi:tetraacyldisaccharide 4'-kinase